MERGGGGQSRAKRTGLHAEDSGQHEQGSIEPATTYRHLLTSAAVSPWPGYVVAVVGTAVAALFRFGLAAMVGENLPPFITFYPVVIFAGLLGGLAPGLVATVLCVLAVDVLFLEPVGRLAIYHPAAQVGVALFVGINIVVSFVAGSLRAVRARAAISEARLRATFNQAAVGIFEVDTQDRIIMANERASELLGYAREQFIGMSITEVTHPDDRATSAQLNRDVHEGRQRRVDYEKRYVRRDGSPVWVHVTVSNVRDSQGRDLGSVGTFEDISARKQAELSLQQTRDELQRQVRLFEGVASTTPDFVYIFDRQGRLLYANRRLLEVWGMRLPEVLGKTCRELGYEQWHHDMHMREIAQIIETRQAIKGEVPFRAQLTGIFGVYEYIFAPVLGLDGEVEFIAGTTRDVTDRKRQEEDLREEAHLARLRADLLQRLQQPEPISSLLQAAATLLVKGLDAAFARVWTLDSSGEVLQLQASAGMYTHLNGPHGRVAVGSFKIGRIAQQRRPLHTNQVIGDPNVPEQDWARREGLVAFGGFPMLLEGRLLGVVALFARHPLSRAAVETLGVIAGTLAEALGRRTAEDSLRASEQFKEALLNSLPAHIVALDPDGVITAVNEPWLRFARENGAPDTQTISLGANYLEVCRRAVAAGDGFASEALDGLRVVLAGHRHNFTLEYPCSSPAQQRWFLMTANLLPSNGGLVVSHLDITTRKRAELDLQRRTVHLQLLHRAAAQLLIGQHPVELLRELHGEIAQLFGADTFMLYQAAPGKSHLHLVACAGVTEQQQQRLQTLRYGRALCAKPQEARQPIIATHIQEHEAPNRRFIRKLGLRSYLYYPLILNNHLHGTIAFASHERDEYDQTDLDFFHTIAGTLAEALERERLESELQRHAANLDRLVRERTAKLEETVAELEHFSYTITHDMRAPLRAMCAFSQMLLQDCPDRLDTKHRDFLRRISDAALRMDQLITDALDYSQAARGQLELRRVDTATLVRGILESYPKFQPPAADIQVAALPPVLANEAALTQVFSNLIGNAVKFVSPGVRPTIRIWSETLPCDRRFSALNPGASAQRVRICVEDNGIGIPPEYHEKIWQMFQRLSKNYDGTGIGLALVRKVVERMRGKAGVESQPGRGSRFWIELPEGGQPKGNAQAPPVY